MNSGKHRRRNVHATLEETIVVTSCSFYAMIGKSDVVSSFSFYAALILILRESGVVLVFMLHSTWEESHLAFNRGISRDGIQYTSNIARIAFNKSALKVTKCRLLDFLFLKAAKPRIPLIPQRQKDEAYVYRASN